VYRSDKDSYQNAFWTASSYISTKHMSDLQTYDPRRVTYREYNAIILMF